MFFYDVDVSICNLLCLTNSASRPPPHPPWILYFSWRLVEDTFTVDEVSEMLDGLQVVVRGEVDTELLNMAHTNVLLLRQLFSQAEKYYLRLQSDISELENRSVIQQNLTGLPRGGGLMVTANGYGYSSSPKHRCHVSRMQICAWCAWCTFCYQHRPSGSGLKLALNFCAMRTMHNRT